MRLRNPTLVPGLPQSLEPQGTLRAILDAAAGSRLPQRRARAAKGEAQDHRGRSETARDSLEAWVPVRTRAAPFSLCARWAGHGSPAVSPRSPLSACSPSFSLPWNAGRLRGEPTLWKGVGARRDSDQSFRSPPLRRSRHIQSIFFSFSGACGKRGLS